MSQGMWLQSVDRQTNQVKPGLYYSESKYWDEDFKKLVRQAGLMDDHGIKDGVFTVDQYDYKIQKTKDGSKIYANKGPIGSFVSKKQWQPKAPDVHYAVKLCFSDKEANDLLAAGKWKVLHGYESHDSEGGSSGTLVLVKVVKE